MDRARRLDNLLSITGRDDEGCINSFALYLDNLTILGENRVLCHPAVVDNVRVRCPLRSVPSDTSRNGVPSQRKAA